MKRNYKRKLVEYDNLIVNVYEQEQRKPKGSPRPAPREYLVFATLGIQTMDAQNARYLASLLNQWAESQPR